MHRKQQARELAERNPVLARDLNIGGPDAPHDYNDGGLADVNQVPGDVLASRLYISARHRWPQRSNGQSTISAGMRPARVQG